jgi:uncharacterized membrane protein YhaH (DUF805 family)
MSEKIGLLEHFRKLATFEGREDRASFWPYAAFVLGIVLMAASFMAIPMIMRSMRAMQEFAVRGSDPGVVKDSYGLEEFSTPFQVEIPGMLPPPVLVAAFLAATYGLAIVLLAAAVVRRLHDRGRSGAWGLMPLPFILFTSIQAPRMFDSMARGGSPDMGMLIALVLGNILFSAALLALIMLLAGASDPQPNAYDRSD